MPYGSIQQLLLSDIEERNGNGGRVSVQYLLSSKLSNDCFLLIPCPEISSLVSDRKILLKAHLNPKVNLQEPIHQVQDWLL